jgi:hypothetical protein
MNTLSHIRSLAIGRANTLQSCHRAAPELRSAFAEWNAGDIYVCKKTGDYRYRYGTDSKAVAPWSKLALQTFPSVAAFAFAAIVLGPAAAPAAEPKAAQSGSKSPKRDPKPAGNETNGRANIIALATAKVA